MQTEQSHRGKGKIEEIMEQFSKEKTEDPLINYWIERKKEKDWALISLRNRVAKPKK